MRVEPKQKEKKEYTKSAIMDELEQQKRESVERRREVIDKYENKVFFKEHTIFPGPAQYFRSSEYDGIETVIY